MNSSGGDSKRGGERRSQDTPCLVNLTGCWSVIPDGTRYFPTLERVVPLQTRERCGSGRRRMPSAGEAGGQGGQALEVAESSDAGDQGGRVGPGLAAG